MTLLDLLQKNKTLSIELVEMKEKKAEVSIAGRRFIVDDVYSGAPTWLMTVVYPKE
jgi:hypothetical protein